MVGGEVGAAATAAETVEGWEDMVVARVMRVAMVGMVTAAG